MKDNKDIPTTGKIAGGAGARTSSYIANVEAEALESFHKAIETQVFFGGTLPGTEYKTFRIDSGFSEKLSIGETIGKYGEEATRQSLGNDIVDTYLEREQTLKKEEDLEAARKIIYND